MVSLTNHNFNMVQLTKQMNSYTLETILFKVKWHKNTLMLKILYSLILQIELLKLKTYHIPVILLMEIKHINNVDSLRQLDLLD